MLLPRGHVLPVWGPPGQAPPASTFEATSPTLAWFRSHAQNTSKWLTGVPRQSSDYSWLRASGWKDFSGWEVKLTQL